MTPPIARRPGPTSSFVALLRGINVGGRNPIRMPELVECFADEGFSDVRTHQNSGNVLFSAGRGTSPTLQARLEELLRDRFGIDITTIVRSRDELAATIAAAPPDHGSATLRSDVFFLKHPLTADAVMSVMPDLRDGVDAVAPGPGALYFSRVRAQASKTRITVLMGMPIFRQMTVRTWGVTTRLSALLDQPGVRRQPG